MLTFQQVKRLAEQEIKKMFFLGGSDSLEIIDSATIDKDYVSIFFYSSRIYLETGDMEHAIGGNAPFFISKVDGQIYTFPTGLTTDEMIDAFEEEQKLWRLTLGSDFYTDNKNLMELRRILNFSNDEIVEYKNSKKLIITTGAKKRLSKIQTLLQDKQIQTRLVENTIA